MLQVEKVSPESDDVDHVIDGPDRLNLLIHGVLDCWAEIKRNLRAVSVAVAREATIRRQEVAELVMAWLSALHCFFTRLANMHVQYQTAIFAWPYWCAHFFANLCVAVPLFFLAVGILQPVNGFMSGAWNIFDCLG